MFYETLRILYSLNNVVFEIPHYENNSCTKHADWFDTVCTEARSVYLDALRVFNALKTPDSRHDLCTKKLHYKSLVRKKKSA